MLWPYQPLPNECVGQSLEQQNGKLFPLRKLSGNHYSEYMDLLGLAAVLNAKYRERTFDFLGEGLVGRIFRDSVARRGWEPSEDVKGSVQLPVLASRK